MQFDDDFSFFFVFGINLFLEYNPILSVLSLIMIYLDSTLVLSILNYEYVAAVLILIYIGAISVLILFIIMMYQINETEMDQFSRVHEQYLKLFTSSNNFFLNNILLLSICTYIGYVLNSTIQHMYKYCLFTKINLLELCSEPNIITYQSNVISNLDMNSNINSIMNLFYTYYSYPLVIAAIFLFFIVSICINLILKHN